MLSILLVDDEPSVCRAFKMLLEHDGHKVQTADDGETALTMFKPNMFDLIITDYSMPGMKGVQMAALMKQRQPNLAIIMATASADDFNRGGKQSVGVDFVINKPFSQKELREAITRVLP